MTLFFLLNNFVMSLTIVLFETDNRRKVSKSGKNIHEQKF